jgi:hypothetical protein
MGNTPAIPNFVRTQEKQMKTKEELDKAKAKAKAAEIIRAAIDALGARAKAACATREVFESKAKDTLVAWATSKQEN